MGCVGVRIVGLVWGQESLCGTHVVLDLGVRSRHDEQVDDLVPVETHSIVQGCVPLLENRTASSSTRAGKTFNWT